MAHHALGVDAQKGMKLTFDSYVHPLPMHGDHTESGMLVDAPTERGAATILPFTPGHTKTFPLTDDIWALYSYARARAQSEAGKRAQRHERFELLRVVAETDSAGHKWGGSVHYDNHFDLFYTNGRGGPARRIYTHNDNTGRPYFLGSILVDEAPAFTEV